MGLHQSLIVDYLFQVREFKGLAAEFLLDQLDGEVVVKWVQVIGDELDGLIVGYSLELANAGCQLDQLYSLAFVLLPERGVLSVQGMELSFHVFAVFGIHAL